MNQTTLQQRILDHLTRPGAAPQRRTDLAKALGLSDDERRHLRPALTKLEEAGDLVRLKKNHWAPAPKKATTWTGIVRINDRGAGFFVSDDGKTELFIARDDMKCALNEDRVRVERLPQRARRPGARRGTRSRSDADLQAEARVVEVLERARSEVVGLLRRSRYYAYVIPDDLRLGKDVRVRGTEKGLEEVPEDHKVVIRLDEWTDPFKPLTGLLTEDLGHRDAPGVDMQCILRAHGFRQSFPEAVQQEVVAIQDRLTPEELGRRRDLRDRMTFTIDPETARDFDDALSLEKHGDGWTLSVHIADVALYVDPGSGIDQEALHRGNSVYLVDRVVMMLPEELTTRLCSLNPETDRPAHTVEIQLDAEGRMTGFETTRSVIHSNARLTYEQVQALFDGDSSHGISPAVTEVLHQLRPLVRSVRKRRIAAGSLELNTPQVQCILGADGKVASIRKGEAKEAYQLVEECMLLANIAVACTLREAGREAMHRIHEEPDQEQWAQMGAELQALGIPSLPTTREEINAVIERTAGTPLDYTATLAVLRNLKRAGYSADAAGHFGLAFEDYVHFTSPIRRYPDLVVHRALSALEQKSPPPYSKADIASMAAQCSRTETEADAAEKESIDLRRIEYYNDLLMKGETGPWTAAITRILNKGLMIELTDTLQRGLIPFASLTDDHYELNKEKTSATGQRHRKTFTIGNTIDVELVHVDIARKLADFVLYDPDAVRTPPRRGTKKKGPRPGRKRTPKVTLKGTRTRGPKTKARRRLK